MRLSATRHRLSLNANVRLKMHTRSTWIALLITAAVVLLVYLVIEPWIAASRSIWPEITAPAQLLADAAKIVAADTNRGAIPESQWPETIRNMRPRYLTKDDGYLLATISTGGINPGWGYAIYPDGRTNNPVKAYRTDEIAIHPGVFRVRHIE